MYGAGTRTQAGVAAGRWRGVRACSDEGVVGSRYREHGACEANRRGLPGGRGSGAVYARNDGGATGR